MSNRGTASHRRRIDETKRRFLNKPPKAPKPKNLVPRLPLVPQTQKARVKKSLNLSMGAHGQQIAGVRSGIPTQMMTPDGKLSSKGVKNYSSGAQQTLDAGFGSPFQGMQGNHRLRNRSV
jgi:hypothetical protein